MAMSAEELDLASRGQYSKLSQAEQKRFVSEANLGILFDTYDVNKDGIIDTMEASPPPKELGSQGLQSTLIVRTIVGWAIADISALPLYKEETTGWLTRTLVTKALVNEKIMSLGAEELDALTTGRYSKLSQTEQKELLSEANLGMQFDTFDKNKDGIIDDSERGVEEDEDVGMAILDFMAGFIMFDTGVPAG
eukprot:CAMPEP_0119299680 /NCGR_PEP_ID=MMETSP1333-20130426/1727_1 /TAXON_ID=418940 /ORGANISM="Scyphosphaera apsteinii, Strain RCC1455" /LENGTH=192 /DNA_ID=CAMNT_0007301189 /DNA_START=140 /DNA_END=718 /DNA_ORIENTATION=-